MKKKITGNGKNIGQKIRKAIKEKRKASYKDNVEKVKKSTKKAKSKKKAD
jgi:hypothetical protein